MMVENINPIRKSLISNGTGKNLIAIAIVIAGVLIAGALIYLDMNKDLRERGRATVSHPETSQPQTEIPQTENPQDLMTPASLAEFAKCLTQKGAKFYGAYWCPWCQKQKELFGEAAQFLPYVECIDKETNEMTEECQNVGVLAFPTWEFPEKGQAMGFKTIEELSEFSGCPLAPQ